MSYVSMRCSIITLVIDNLSLPHKVRSPICSIPTYHSMSQKRVPWGTSHSMLPESSATLFTQVTSQVPN